MKQRKKGLKIEIVSYTRQYAQKLEEAGRLATGRNYRTLTRHLERFLCDGKTWGIAETDYSKVSAFCSYLQRRGITRNSLSAYLRVLRSLLRHAELDGLAPYNPRWFDGMYTGIDHTAKRSVGRDVIKRLRDLRLTAGSAIELTRDLWLFSFYTRGMAFVDMAHLDKKNIIGNTLVYRRHKSHSILRMELLPCMKAIIDKWRTGNGPLLFPVLEATASGRYDSALRVYNKRLKRLGAMIGEPNLTSYTSRHSWANAAREQNVPVSVISSGMGHSSELTTRIYLREIADTETDKANRKITAL